MAYMTNYGADIWHLHQKVCIKSFVGTFSFQPRAPKLSEQYILTLKCKYVRMGQILCVCFVFPLYFPRGFRFFWILKSKLVCLRFLYSYPYNAFQWRRPASRTPSWTIPWWPSRGDRPSPSTVGYIGNRW